MMPHNLAVWLLKVVVPTDQFEPVMGDFMEEFTDRVKTLGLAPARHWFWRHAWKTIAHYFFAQFREAPAANVFVILSAQPLLVFSREPSYFAARVILANSHPYYWISAYAFWFIYDILIGSILIPMLVGWFSAAMARGRETAVTVTLA